MSENIPYIIAEDGYYYVAYKEKVKVPELVVSSKGVANGLSEEYNDGWDFGPDSYSPTSTSAIPYTQTAGIQEAANYLLPNGGGEILIKRGVYLIDTTIFINSISADNNTLPHPTFYIHGEGANIGGNLQDYPVGTWLQPSPNFDTSAFGGWLMVSNFTDNSKVSHIGFMGMNPAGTTVASGYLSLGDYNIKISKNVAYGCVNGFWLTSSGNSGQMPVVSENQTVGCTNYAFASEEITINGTTYSAFSGDGGVSQGNFLYNYDAASHISYWLHGHVNNSEDIRAILSIGNISDQPIAEGFHTFHHTYSLNDHITIITSTLQSANAIALVFDNTNYNADKIYIENFSVSDYLTTTDQSIIQTTGGTNTVEFNLINPYIYESGTSTTNPIYNGNGTMILKGGTITSNRNIISLGSAIMVTSEDFSYINYSSGNKQFAYTSSVAGTTAGIVYIALLTNKNIIKYIIYIDGYENDTTTNQGINFPVAFATQPDEVVNGTGLSIYVGPTGFGITAPDSTTTYSGIVIVEGY